MTFALINEFIGLPELASEHGEMVDTMLELVHWFMLILAVGWSIFLVIVLTKFRQKKNPKADYYGVRGHHSTHVEIAVVIVEAILLLGFAFPLWNRQVEQYPTDANTVKVRAVGEKFFWTFHYPGDDGVFGRTDPRAITPANQLGRDMDDPNGKDDFMNLGELILPNERPVVIDVVSKDVIHNLHVVPMRIAQDAIPGSSAQMWFKPIKTGEWDILCGQLCGPAHANMKATLAVVPDEEYKTWSSGKSSAALAQREAEEAKEAAVASAQ
jgi:cytochrome c oxidase subunit II